jgi:O-antigen/teichoic acid export membrane protein
LTTRLRSAGWILAAQVAGVLLAFPMSVLLARALGPSGKGTVTVVQLIASLGSIVLSAGLPGAITYLSAKHQVSAAAVVRLAWTWALAVGALFIALSLIGGPALAKMLLHTDSPALLVLGGLALIPMLVVAFVASYAIGAGRLRAVSIINITALAAQLGVLVALWTIHLLTPASAILTWIIVSLGSAVAACVLALSSPAHGEPIVHPVDILRRGWRFGLASWFASGLGLLSLRVDVFLVSALAGTAAVGVYSISVTLAELAWYVPNSVYTTLFPRVAADGHGSVEMTSRVNRMLWPLTLVLSAGVALVGGWLIPFFFGPAFSGALLPLWLLVPGITAYAAGIVPGAFMAGIGKPQIGGYASVVNLGVNVVANLILIPRLGISGAALASSLSYAFGTSVLVTMYVRSAGISLKTALVPSWGDIRSFASSLYRVILGKDPAAD